MNIEENSVLYEERAITPERHFQVRRGIPFYKDGHLKIQSFINNISFPKSLEELYFYAVEHGYFNVEDILYEDIVSWTVPRWAKIGDIVFFMHAKTARTIITRLRTELIKQKISYLPDDYDLLMSWIQRGLDLYNRFGGKIFAIGRVCGAPEYIPDDAEGYEDSSFYHWGSRLYADIELDVLNEPIDISEFNSFIFISRQSAITGVFGKEYEELRELIQRKNVIPAYFANSIASPLPLSKVNPTNWMELTAEYRRCFMLESQFRSYYVDYLLRELGDRKTFSVNADA